MLASMLYRQRILIIDDDINQIKVLKKALSSTGDVFFEQNGLLALQQALVTLPDLILLDIEMPNINGHQVLEQLKLHEQTCHIPVIFITAHHSETEQIKCLSAGAVDFISKPLQPEIVVARVNTHLALRRRELELLALSQKYQITLNSIGDGVVTTDKNGAVTYINPAAELLIGITEQKAIGLIIEELMPLRIGNDGPPHINPIRICIDENRQVGMAVNCQMMRQNGHWVCVEHSAAPLIEPDDKVTGAVIVFHDINEINAMGRIMTHSLQYDQLTNLPNRFLFLDMLNAEISLTPKKPRKIGLIQFDIDNFKSINQEFGFEVGDEILKKTAQIIQSTLQSNEILSRHNADEFRVLASNLTKPSDLANLAMVIREQVKEIISAYPDMEHFSISAGISIFPDDANNGELLMLHADAALQRAKQNASNQGCCFYSQEMESEYILRKHCYSLLKKAITDNSVITLYQPIVDAHSGQLKAVEALMRIQDEDGQLISPDNFIPIAEETRLIIPLGEQMIQRIFEQLHHWSQDGLAPRVCINISVIQFVDPNFVPFLLNAIEQYQVSPNVIELEVTESLMIENIDHIQQDMHTLRALGITISIDDFGTGFSCLSYLKDLPIDVVKIDKSFVAQLSAINTQDILISTIISLAQNMNLASIAEGVETIEQAKALKQLGATCLQGYYFSRPVAASEIKDNYNI
ncbi:two-component system response regulator [Shewanella subflava]|uniref:EAL domain-containing protein n=1 Tax=Shewanella subflava TaxID=2986476 RepID=A0ABT3ICX2_9GAMM|nr:EAL domain-containing protein [Shewanella subflava]MCW3173892.1 EAL domain-containing protein [Shewanella subflava]